MEDNQKIYLDKVIEYLLRGTKIDYDKKYIHYPFIHVHFNTRIDFIHGEFKNYCNNVYGLTEDEIKYIWGEFITIVKDKIENGK
jgi:hypothetical protein